MGSNTSLFFSYFVIAILVDMKWFFIMVLICISLMTDDVEHLFMSLLAICLSHSHPSYKWKHQQNKDIADFS